MVAATAQAVTAELTLDMSWGVLRARTAVKPFCTKVQYEVKLVFTQ
jgi:hypothetical protein